MDDFWQLPNPPVDRPVINETNLEGEFIFEIAEKHPGDETGTATTLPVSPRLRDR